MKIAVKIVFLLFCWGCSSTTTKYETNLAKANVSRITERLEVMIASEEYAYSENKKLITDSVAGCTEKWAVYDENGKATLFYAGGSEGLMSFSMQPKKGYMPLEEIRSKYECRINIKKNYIIDMAEPKSGRFKYGERPDFITDTIRNFVIIPKDKIILSKDDYELLQQAKQGRRDAKRYILYRYE